MLSHSDKKQLEGFSTQMVDSLLRMHPHVSNGEADALIEGTINEGIESPSNTTSALRQQSTTGEDKLIREYNPPTVL